MIFMILSLKNVDYLSVIHNTTVFREINNYNKIDNYGRNN